MNNKIGAEASAPMDSLPEPPTASVRPYRAHHCHDLALQKYLLLFEQHESLRQHLDELRPPPRHSSICTPVTPNPATSPARLSHLPDARATTPPRAETAEPYNSLSLPRRKASLEATAMAVPEPVSAEEVAIEEAKLCDVNEGMKRALTELLNCDAVRGDRAFRTWVQCRLMDTERELRSGRRRRSAPGP